MIRFFVWKFNSLTESTSLFDICRSGDKAYQIADYLNKTNPHYNYYVGLHDVRNIQYDIDKKLIDLCKSVGNCLYLMDRCLKKRHKFSNADFWYNKALERCDLAAKYLEDD